MFKRLLDKFIAKTFPFDQQNFVCHIDKVIRKNGLVVDDGLHEVFVNTAIDDGSTIAELIKCF